MEENSSIEVLGSGSKGNCYLLKAGEETLLLEAGIPWKDILRGLNFKIDNVVGCLCTHVHADHSKAHKQITSYGIDLYTNAYTVAKMSPQDLRRYHIKENETFNVGNFTVRAFDCAHSNSDGTDCPINGYLIYHKEIGKVLFITDSYKVPGRFKGIDHILIECNYSERSTEDFQAYQKRILRSHMSLENLKVTLSSWDLNGTKDITLIHLSEDNSEPCRFKEEIEGLTGIPTYIAVPGARIGGF